MRAVTVVLVSGDVALGVVVIVSFFGLRLENVVQFTPVAYWVFYGVGRSSL